MPQTSQEPDITILGNDDEDEPKISNKAQKKLEKQAKQKKLASGAQEQEHMEDDDAELEECKDEC